MGFRRAISAYAAVPKDGGYLPNAAIGWKQPNGFYYPPAFHSRNLQFSNVDIRHYVVVPLFKPGTYQDDISEFKNQYVGVLQLGNTRPFNGFTDIDQQTEPNDDDGTLTGFVDTISVNEDPYFTAPIQTAQCRSNLNVDPKYACAPQPTRNQRISVPTARPALTTISRR